MEIDNLKGLIEELKDKAKLLENSSEELKDIINKIQEGSNEEKVTFNNFLDIYISGKTIKIPRIQRNYVQGKNKKIRKKIIDDIFDSIKEDKLIKLDIIFGIIEGNYFIPIDGQQRLTTLFLLHWFIYTIEEGLDERIKNLDILYETRESSKEFFQMLKEYGNIFKTRYDNAKIENNHMKHKEKIRFSKIIKNSIYYYESKWKNDVTVQSALEMLDEIQNHYEKCNTKLKEKLSLITFSCKIIGFEDNINPDELYIKMNSRGKQLNDFEINKSYIEKIASDKYEKSSDKFDYEGFCRNINNKWTNDILYTIDEENRKKNIKYVEEYFYNLIRLFIIYFFTEKSIIKGNKEKLQYIVSIIQRKESFDLGLNEEKTIMDSNFFERFTNVMNNIKNMCFVKENKTVTININIIWKKLIEKGDNNVTDILKFYAIMKYFENRECNIEENYDNFINWLRIVRNFIEIQPHIQIENRQIQDITKISFFKVFRKITKLSEKLKEYPNIINYFFHTSFEASVFNEYDNSQTEKEWYKLEQMKAQLSQENSDWNEEIINADNIMYLAGRIKFLFDFAKKDFNKFRQYRELINAIFYYYPETTEFKEKEEYLLQKAMLCDNKYFIKDREYDTFFNFYDSDNTNVWKKALNENNELNKKFNNFIEKNQLLKIIKIENKDEENAENIKEKFKQIIKTFTNNKHWKYYFINSNSLFKYATKARILIKKESKNLEETEINIFKSQGNSNHKDFLTCYLEEKIQEHIDTSKFIIYYKGKRYTNKFDCSNSLKIENKNDNKEKYVFIRDTNGKFTIELSENINIRFDIYDKEEKEVEENKLEYLKDITGLSINQVCKNN